MSGSEQGGAGHFVKMVYNGIEYGDIRGIAEAYADPDATGHGHDPDGDVQGLLRWDEGRLRSYLIEITSRRS